MGLIWVTRFDPKYTKTEFKKPQKLMFWAGITSSGRRISRFLDQNEMMNSVNFVKVLKKARAPAMLRKNKLTLLQDRATPHISKYTSSFMKSEGFKAKFIPGTSPDFMPVENLFARMKQILENRQTRTMDELKAEVRRAWLSLPKSYLRSLIESMPNRMRLAVESQGNPTKY